MATTTASHKTRSERQAELHHDPRRRPLSVGRVWVVGLVCLMVGALLNASGIRKTALSQPVGWRRDVAKFLAEPLYDVSHALRLDEPRVALLDLIGREDEDKVDLTLPSPTVRRGTPTSTLPGSAGAPKVPEKRKFTPTKAAALWVGGDSLSITPGESVINAALATQVVGLVQPVDGHVATGLARPEVLNWPAYLAQVIAAHHPDVMVLTIGSNDDQPLTGEGGVGPFGSPQWQAEYQRRVGGLMDLVTKDGNTTLFWIGIPQMRNTDRYEHRYRFINDLVRIEAKKRPGKVHFIETAPLLVASPGGGYTDYVTRPDGSVVRIRAPDGIHFERAGADIIANAVLAAMNEAFDLTSWKTNVPTSTTGPTTTTTAPKPGTTTTTYVPRSRG